MRERERERESLWMVIGGCRTCCCLGCLHQASTQAPSVCACVCVSVRVCASSVCALCVLRGEYQEDAGSMKACVSVCVYACALSFAVL